MLLDVDNFKAVNDTMGHEVGDALLKDIATRLHGCARESDTIARFGGDEFAVVLEDLAEPSKAFAVAQKILDAFIPPFVVKGAEVYLASSIGVTFYPSDGEDLDALLKNADSAMYHAKAQGRNNYQFYSAELTERAQVRLGMETSLRRGLERDEFRLHFQPKVELASGRVTGVEALLRWEGRDLVTVAPNDFIPIAEESGLILPIGDWALRTACAEVKRWHDEGLAGLRLAVNLSSRQFRHKRLVASIASILEETGFDATCLEFEITESVLMDLDNEVSEVLGKIKDMGISISIDDFGTGYSSLSYLKRFPIDTLKIDRSFVRDVPADLDDVAIVRAIIAMARSLRMRTVAEGVEQEDQMRFLRAEGCGEMQGFFYSRPLPSEEILRLLKLKARIAFL
jgi:diguanylate cyclase (GGDEF)-like protein